ncbi:MAG: hypothetical protein LBL43_07805 [Treponema sp.]|jgi:hypothetical protein|nr:hypothetical protein [Treponema sp.]
MIQLYFLSIFLNAIAGFVLVSGDGDMEIRTGLSFNNETLRLVLGILSMIVGVLKLLSATEGDIPVLGDLIPALTGFIAGFILIYVYYREHSTLEPEKTAAVTAVLLDHKKIIGFIAMIVGALHFLFPKVLLL